MDALFRILERVSLYQAGDKTKANESQDLKGLSLAGLADVILAKEKFDKVD